MSPAGDTAPLLVNLEQAAEVLGGISRSRLFELLASGEIESVKLGRRRLIPAAALAAFVAQLRSEPVNGSGALRGAAATIPTTTARKPRCADGTAP